MMQVPTMSAHLRTPAKLLPEWDGGSSCHSALSAHSATVAGICSASWTLPEWMTVIQTSRPLPLQCPESLEPHRGGSAHGQLWTSPLGWELASGNTKDVWHMWTTCEWFVSMCSGSSQCHSLLQMITEALALLHPAQT